MSLCKIMYQMLWIAYTSTFYNHCMSKKNLSKHFQSYFLFDIKAENSKCILILHVMLCKDLYD